MAHLSFILAVLTYMLLANSLEASSRGRLSELHPSESYAYTRVHQHQATVGYFDYSPVYKQNFQSDIYDYPQDHYGPAGDRSDYGYIASEPPYYNYQSDYYDYQQDSDGSSQDSYGSSQDRSDYECNAYDPGYYVPASDEYD